MFPILSTVVWRHPRAHCLIHGDNLHSNSHKNTFRHNPRFGILRPVLYHKFFYSLNSANSPMVPSRSPLPSNIPAFPNTASLPPYLTSPYLKGLHNRSI